MAHPAEYMVPSINAPFLQKPLDLIDTTYNLFGFLPDDNDPRWDFLVRYEATKNEIGFRAINFANAWGATYLSDTTSYRSGFVNTQNPENSLQLNRALDNLGHRNIITQRYSATSQGFEEAAMSLVITDSLTTDPTKPKPEVTPCPEALYQIRLRHDDAHLGRVGFNIHHEDNTTVMSIVNVQGAPGGIKRNAQFEREHGETPFNLLVQRAIVIAEVQDSPFEVRGLVNPEKGNSQLYWCALTKQGVPMYHAQRKPEN